jgi:hypothetical protein
MTCRGTEHFLLAWKEYHAFPIRVRGIVCRGQTTQDVSMSIKGTATILSSVPPTRADLGSSSSRGTTRANWIER